MVLQLISFSRIWTNFPAGLRIAGIPVGLLNRQQAAQRLLEVYSTPVEIIYGENSILIPPGLASFELDLESMLAAAEIERTRTPFWQGFWNYLWGRAQEPVDVPLRSSFSEDRLRSFLEGEVARRYDHPATPAQPIPGSVEFQPGQPGTVLDVERSLSLIEEALISNRNRVVHLPLQGIAPSSPDFQKLEILLKQTVLDIHNYDGAIGLYLVDLQSGQEISFYYDSQELIQIPPDIPFTGSSIIKIPIMISAYRRLSDNPVFGLPFDSETIRNLDEMIAKSNNSASDWIMDNIIDPISGPLLVTEDMQNLGLENTFLAGYFYNGAPLLRVYRTPGNQRTDVNIGRDPYSQTTPIEIGVLLQDIYHCSKTGGGSLVAVFSNEITQAECQQMIQYLKNDRTPWLILAGLPDGTEVAHKHGWVSDPFGIIRDISDAGIVFTRGGDYVLSIFMYHPVQLVFEPANSVVADLSRAVYNYYNIPQP
jgi:beta-lactamase class A